MDNISARFLEDPWKLYMLFNSTEKLRALSGIKYIYKSVVLPFTNVGDTGSFEHVVSQERVAFLTLLGYYAEASLRGNLLGVVRLDGAIIFTDPQHFAPELRDDMKLLVYIKHKIEGSWVAIGAPSTAGNLQVYAYGFEIYNRIWAKLQKRYEELAEQLLGDK